MYTVHTTHTSPFESVSFQYDIYLYSVFNVSFEAVCCIFLTYFLTLLRIMLRLRLLHLSRLFRSFASSSYDRFCLPHVLSHKSITALWAPMFIIILQNMVNTKDFYAVATCNLNHQCIRIYNVKLTQASNVLSKFFNFIFLSLSNLKTWEILPPRKRNIIIPCIT